MTRSHLAGLALVAPALLMIVLFFMVPLTASIVGVFETAAGPGFDNLVKAFALYSHDMIFTVVIVGLSTALIGIFSIAIGGYFTLGRNPRAQAMLRFIYRWPMFIPFIVTAQVLRTFLAKNGLMNNTLVATGLLDPASATSLLDWRGIVVAFVWKQTPFVALMVAGAMASIDRATIEAARNLGARRLRLLFEIVVPQAAPTLMVGLVLSFVTMMSVLSVPLMINAQSPTMITADIAFRINAYRDYGVANALGLISLAITGVAAYIYLRQGVADRR
ncbi:ABC transporter permease [Pseudoxanthobacter soli]|nr:ABC transporter permease subunit [Pseudoxanthobacter soli]